MKKILFIHGFNGSKESSTGQSVKAGLNGKYEYIAENFDLLDVEGTLSKIQEIIKREKIDLLCGTSFGSFYVLASDFAGEKLVINPCMKPSEEIPKLDPSFLSEVVSKLEEIESKIYTGQIRENIKGLFSTSDELFGEKFIPLFKANFGEQVFRFEGTHHGGSEKLSEAVRKIIGKIL